MGGSKRPPAPQNPYYWEFEHNSFSLTRESFSTRKLKGNHTFMAQSTAVEDHETEEDPGPTPIGKKEVKSSAEKDAEMMGKVSDVDPLLGFIV